MECVLVSGRMYVREHLTKTSSPHKLPDRYGPNLVRYIRTARSHGVVLPILMYPIPDRGSERGVLPQILVFYSKILFSEFARQIQTKLATRHRDHAIT